MSTFSETIYTIIEGVTSLQEQYLQLQEQIEALGSELEVKTDRLNAVNTKNQDLIRQLRNLRKENKKLRKNSRPVTKGVKVSGSVHVQETRQPYRRNNNSRRNNRHSQASTPVNPSSQTTTGHSPGCVHATRDNIPSSDATPFQFQQIPPEIAEQLQALLNHIQSGNL